MILLNVRPVNYSAYEEAMYMFCYVLMKAFYECRLYLISFQSGVVNHEPLILTLPLSRVFMSGFRYFDYLFILIFSFGFNDHLILKQRVYNLFIVTKLFQVTFIASSAFAIRFRASLRYTASLHHSPLFASLRYTCCYFFMRLHFNHLLQTRYSLQLLVCCIVRLITRFYCLVCLFKN